MLPAALIRALCRFLVMKDVNEIKAMWNEWKSLPFPANYSGKDVEGICITSLDSYAAGCIDTFISRKGSLDAWRISVLEKCRDDLEIVLPKLDGEARTYFERLLKLSKKVLSLVGR
jgi:hypothetical protein